MSTIALLDINMIKYLLGYYIFREGLVQETSLATQLI